jgi:hypothetical protein
MLNLRKFAEEFVATGWYRDKDETARDNAVIEAINACNNDTSSRNKALVDWLSYYKVLMGFSGETRIRLADQILGFADERNREPLSLDRQAILSEFERLEARLKIVTSRRVISLASKGLWCCYPNSVPIYDRNAVTATRAISRISRMAPEPGQSEYGCFLDLWIRVYREVEPVIDQADLTGCPQKVRVLDKMLWYLGDTSFYDSAGPQSA